MSVEKINILFRVDGGAEIGMGHLVRSLALACQLARSPSVEPIFLMKNDRASVRKVTQQGFSVRRMVPSIDLDEEIALTVKAMQEFHTRVLVTDILNVNLGYLKGVKKKGESSLIISIDDLGTVQDFADIVINGSIVDERLQYGHREARYYLGTDYFILKADFLKAHQKKRVIRKNGRSVLITMGGSDPKQLTAKVLKALEKLERDLRITAVVGPAFGHHNSLKSLAESSKGKIRFRYDVVSMADVMLLADIAFCAGGDTLYELAAAGTPSIVLAFGDLERVTAEAMHQKGAAVSLGLGEQVTAEQIRAVTERLLDDLLWRRQLSERGKGLVDGRGLERITQLLFPLLSTGSLVSHEKV